MVTPRNLSRSLFDSYSRFLGKLPYPLLFVIVAFVVLFPCVDLIQTSFQVNSIGRETNFGLQNWAEVFTTGHMIEVFWNTMTLSFTRQTISLVVGVAIAWLIARTDLPGRDWIELGFWIALFIPALPVAMAWILLAGGHGALLNIWLTQLFPSLTEPFFNIYSWGGIVWVHLITGTLPVKVFLLVPAFRAMDASMEESARACGSGLMQTLSKIVVPVMIPTLLVVLLLGMIRSMQAFEIELVLGTPAGIDVYSTDIYRALRQEPPLYGVGSALSICFVAIIIPFVLLQQRFGHARAHATVGGKFSTRLQGLGAWKWPLFGILALLLLIMTLLPTVMLLVGSFMKMFGDFSLPELWTTRHWASAFSRDDLLLSLKNTLVLGAGAAILGMVLFSVLAYLLVKRRHFGARTLDFLTWMPTVIPGIVLSLAYLQMFVKVPLFRPMYGTMWILIIAVVIASMTVGVQVIKSSLAQINNELEEASSTTGANAFQTFTRIVLPLIAPAVAAIGLQTFATAVSVVSVVSLLGTGPNQPLSILQLVFLDSGRFEAATIVGLLIVAITIVAALFARFVSSRYGLARA
jgi:iron(III) transport system permease protein